MLVTVELLTFVYRMVSDRHQLRPELPTGTFWLLPVTQASVVIQDGPATLVYWEFQVIQGQVLVFPVIQASAVIQA